MRNVWIKHRLKELGKTQAALARHLDLPPARVSEIIKGEREVATDEVGPLARFLQISSVDVLHNLHAGETIRTTPQTVRVSHYVQAGEWVEENVLPDDEQVEVSLPPIDAPGARIYGLRVRGNSMDEWYPDGSIVFCVSTLDVTRPLAHGDHVVVERRAQCDGMEATIKQLEQAEDGTWWLVPKSTDPRQQTALPFSCDEDVYDDGGVPPIRVTGLVIADMRFRSW